MNNMRNLCCNIALQCWKLDVKILIPGSWIIVCIGNWKLYCTVVHGKFFRKFNAKKNIETGAKIFGAVGLGSDNVNLASLALRGVEPAIYQKVQVIYSYGIAQYDTAFSGCNWLIECYILFEDLPLTSCLRATWPPHLTSVSLPVRAAP